MRNSTFCILVLVTPSYNITFLRLLVCSHQDLPLYTARNRVQLTTLDPCLFCSPYLQMVKRMHVGVALKFYHRVISPILSCHGGLKPPAIRTYDDKQGRVTFSRACCVSILFLMYAMQRVIRMLSRKSLQSPYTQQEQVKTLPPSTIDGLTIAVPKMTKGVLLVAVLYQDRYPVRFFNPIQRVQTLK